MILDLFLYGVLLAQSEHGPVVTVREALAPPPELLLPEGAKLILRIDGEEGEASAFGLCALDDVDGDGTADFVIVSGWSPATARSGARVHSGSTGRPIAFAPEARLPVHGPQSSIVALGDVDADGARDFGTEWGSWEEGVVRVFSSRDGSVIFELEGSKQRQVGWLLPAGDLDCDGYADFLSYAGGAKAFSGRTGEALPSSEFDRFRSDDTNGDGFSDRPDPTPFGGRYVTGLSGHPLLVARPRRDFTRLHDWGSIGDVDADGFLDLFVSGLPSVSRATAIPQRVRAEILSGRSGGLLHSFEDGLHRYEERVPLQGVRDWDGDGNDDLVTKHWLAPHTVLLCRSGADLSVLWTVASRSLGFGFQFTLIDDVDGDGRPELLIGDPLQRNATERGAGRTYVISFRGA